MYTGRINLEVKHKYKVCTIADLYIMTEMVCRQPRHSKDHEEGRSRSVGVDDAALMSDLYHYLHILLYNDIQQSLFISSYSTEE